MVELSKPKKSSGFFSHVITLLSGKGGEAIIGFIFLPVIARLFEPDVYGISVSLIAISTLILPFATLTYQRAIVLTDNKTDEAGLFILSALSALVVSFIFIFLLQNGFISSFFDDESKILSWLWIVPAYVLIRMIKLVLEQSAIKQKKYKLIASSGVADVAAAMSFRILCGMRYGSELFILIAAYSLGTILKIMILAKMTRIWNVFLGAGKLSIQETARRYIDFPKYQLPGTLFRNAANNLPIILLAASFSSTVAGIYGMATALSRRPLEMLLMSYRSVFLQQGSLIVNDNKLLRNLFIKHTSLLIVATLIPFILIFFFVTDIFNALLGDKWSEASEYVKLLLPWLFSMLISLPAAATLILKRNQKLWMNITAFISIFQLAPFLVSTRVVLSVEEILWFYSLIGMVGNILLIVITSSKISNTTNYV